MVDSLLTGTLLIPESSVVRDTCLSLLHKEEKQSRHSFIP